MKKFLNFLKKNYKLLNTTGLILAVISIFLIFIFSNSNLGTNVLFLGCVCVLVGYYGEYTAKKSSSEQPDTETSSEN